MAAPASAGAGTLPDNRSYELVSRIQEAGGESLLNGSAPLFTAAADGGGVVDWQAVGACCGTDAGGFSTYRSVRGSGGWGTRVITPAPSAILTGIQEVQETVSWNKDLSETIFSTPASYAAGDQRPTGSGGDDLYLDGPSGELEWLSQGPLGSGKGPYRTRFDAATSNLSEVLFSTAEPLTSSATGLTSQKWAQYLYARDVGDETTSLINVDGSGNPINAYGATLGDSGPPEEDIFSFGYRGSTTHAVSEDGSKVFFETPPAGVEGLPEGVEPHLYMRNLADDTTTPIDNPAVPGLAHYEGASADGSLVFFTSNEGLDGASTADELYEFNTTANQIGQAPPMLAVPLASGTGIMGVTAISNDGSHVFFVAREVLAPNVNSAGLSAVANEPNLYVHDTGTGETKFITTLAWPDVSTCKPTCAGTEAHGLINAADIFRPAYPTPDGSVLVFTSSNRNTGEDHTPSTTLTGEALPGEHTLDVESTAGFHAHGTIAVASGEQEELETVEAVDSPTELTVSEFSPVFNDGFLNQHPSGSSVTERDAQVYRYASADGTLRCLSCTPAGTYSTQSAALGEVGGGTYAPAGSPAQMSADGSRIFFESPDPLLPGMAEAESKKLFEPTSLYEWEKGKVSLISDAANDGNVFHGTTSSGNDVFFDTRSRLVPGALSGYEHIYDARVDGGFPQEAPATAPCVAEACRALSAPTNFFPLPPSASIDEPGGGPGREALPPTFSVSPITAGQRANLARSGRLVLKVAATAPGRILASVTARLRGRPATIAQASVTLHAAAGATLRLHLSRAARSALARGRALALRIEVNYQATGGVDVADLTLKTVAARRHAARKVARHG